MLLNIIRCYNILEPTMIFYTEVNVPKTNQLSPSA